MFDLNWLVGECPLLKRLPELIILHGDGRNLQYEAKALNVQNMKSFQPKLPVRFERLKFQFPQTLTIHFF